MAMGLEEQGDEMMPMANMAVRRWSGEIMGTAARRMGAGAMAMAMVARWLEPTDDAMPARTELTTA